MAETHRQTVTADRYDVLIVGGGQGGSQAAAALRQGDFKGSVGLITDESEPPYERPQLSKTYLAGELAFEDMLLRPSGFWEDKSIDLVMSDRVEKVDPVARSVTTHGGRSVGYNHLIWSAGGTPKALTCAGYDLEGVHCIRNRIDIDRIKLELPDVRDVVVIGGGYIGLEAAAVLRKLGKSVVVLEALDRVLTRVAGETLSRFFEAEHRAHGVDIKLNAKVVSIIGREGRINGVKLADGSVSPADLAIVGIGIRPNVGPLIEAGAAGENGVDVDAQCRTTLPHIFAIGDCARHASRYADGARVRLESVQNADDQAQVAAKTIMGSPACYDAVPWFWSDQFDLRLQTVGLFNGFDHCIVRGSKDERNFSIVYTKGGQIIALDCVNSTRDFVQGKRLVAAQVRVSVDQLADSKVSLKSFLA